MLPIMSSTHSIHRRDAPKSETASAKAPVRGANPHRTNKLRLHRLTTLQPIMLYLSNSCALPHRGTPTAIRS